MKGIAWSGDVKSVMKEIAEARGWTVEQLIKLYRLEEVERAQRILRTEEYQGYRKEK